MDALARTKVFVGADERLRQLGRVRKEKIFLLLLQRIPLTRAFEGFFSVCLNRVFVHVNQLFPWFSTRSDREGSLIAE